MIGTSLGPYRILEALGAGGMGEVYLAEDTRLGRKVAVKVLPAALTADAASVARLEQEARLLAQLEHPNVASVYGLEVARVQGGNEPVRHLVMQLAEGEPLSARIAGGPLPLDEALEIARQVAAGVGAAHDKGIIHRDLKPANVMVADGPGGRPVVKVLDFGLAKALLGDAERQSRDLTTSPTVAAATAAGVIMGTAAYMSPEQARGKPVDRRTDVWAFGCLLYEMLVGRAAFQGDTVSDLIAAILTREPDWTALPPALPRAAARAIRRCLSQDVDRRPYDVRDVVLEIGAAEDRPVNVGAAAAPASGAGRGWLAFAGLLVLAAAAGFALARFGAAPRPAADAGVAQAPTLYTQLTFHSGAEAFPSISADGEWIVYASSADGDWDVYLQSVGGDNAINLTEDSDADDWMPALSPDGRQIAFRSERGDGGIYVMGRTGESVRRLSDAGYNPAWAPDGARLVVASELISDTPYSRESVSELTLIDVASGVTTALATGDAVQPAFAPDGQWIVYWGLPKGTGQRDLWAAPLNGDPPVPLLDDAATDWTPVFTPDGAAVVFSSDRGGTLGLWRLDIDPASKRPAGPPRLLVPGSSQWVAYPTFAADTGALVYATMGADIQIRRAILDGSLRALASPVVALTSGSRHALSPDISPDGEWLAFASGQGQQEDIYLQRLDGSLTRRLTNDVFKDRSPRFSPDGRTLAFYAARTGSYGIWTIDVDGSNLRSLTTDVEGASHNYPVWSAAGDRILTQRTRPDDSRVTAMLSTGPEGVPSTELEIPIPAGITGFQVTDWSVDGNRILGDLVSTTGRLNGALLFDMRTGTSRRLTDFGAQSAFLSDDRYIAFTTPGELWVADTTSGEFWSVLSVRPDRMVEYVSSLRDELGVVFSVRRQEDDLWMAEWR